MYATGLEVAFVLRVPRVYNQTSFRQTNRQGIYKHYYLSFRFHEKRGNRSKAYVNCLKFIWRRLATPDVGLPAHDGTLHAVLREADEPNTKKAEAQLKTEATTTTAEATTTIRWALTNYICHHFPTARKTNIFDISTIASKVFAQKCCPVSQRNAAPSHKTYGG